jgi:hypothetical protein
MTEAEWLTGYFHRRMYDVIRNQATTRQVRLFMVACCRLMTAEFFDPRIPLALQIAEQCADDPSAESVAESVWAELITSPTPCLPTDGPEGEIADGITAIQHLLHDLWDGENYEFVQQTITHAAYLCLREKPQKVFTGGAGDAVEYCIQKIVYTEVLLAGGRPPEEDLDGPETDTNVRRAIAHLLRDIFGNPFRPVSIDPLFLTETVVSLAEQMYESRDFAAMPILSDALLDAGCDNEDVLNHYREPGPHVRGCWVVDLVLGKR